MKIYFFYRDSLHKDYRGPRFYSIPLRCRLLLASLWGTFYLSLTCILSISLSLSLWLKFNSLYKFINHWSLGIIEVNKKNSIFDVLNLTLSLLIFSGLWLLPTSLIIWWQCSSFTSCLCQLFFIMCLSTQGR